MELKNVILQTENLILTPIENKYSEIIFNEFTDEIAAYMIPEPAKDIGEIKHFIKNAIGEIEDEKSLHLIILNKDTLEFIGGVGIYNIDRKDPELGIWIKKSAHGNSYGLEAILKLVEWANDNLDFEYLRYPVDKRNYASRRIAEKNNGKIKKEYKEINQVGFELDNIEYWIYKY